MAETSLQALMRHQNHRRMKTLPVPAPTAMRNVHAPAIDSWYQVTTQEASITRTVATCETRDVVPLAPRSARGSAGRSRSPGRRRPS